MIRIPLVLLGLLLTTVVRAELPASLELAVSKISGVSTQRQEITGSLEDALKIGVRGQDLQALMRLATAQQYSVASTSSFVREITEAKRNGLPVTPIRDKLLEGMAKKVQTEKILVVSSQWRSALTDADVTVRAIEARGLSYSKASEREALVVLGASLQQRYGVKNALSKFDAPVSKNSNYSGDANRLIAAANLTEMLLLHKVPIEQSLDLPISSLRAGYTAAQIYAQQRNIQDQIRQGMAPVDIIAEMRHQFSGKSNVPFATSGFESPGQLPGGGFPGGTGVPGGSFPAGPAMPGNSFPVGPAVPGGGFPVGGGRN